jgi:hypothetical protein
VSAVVWMLALCAAPAQEPDGAPVRVETQVPPAPVLREEPFLVRVRVHVDAAFLREKMLQPYRRAIECPVQMEVPWLAASPDWIVRAARPVADAAPRLVMNGSLTPVDAIEVVVAGGREWTIFTIERTLLARAAGMRTLAAPILRYAWTPHFATDVFGTAVPAERRDALVRGVETTLAVREWPAEGRPPSFDGAVGTLTLRAERDPDAPAERLAVRILVEGHGNWESWSGPALDALPGLHLLGRMDTRSEGRLEVRADFLLDADGPIEFPALDYGHLEPGPPPAFRIARSAAIPFRMVGELPPPAREVPPSRDGDATWTLRNRMLWSVSAIVALLVLGFALAARARASARPASRGASALGGRAPVAASSPSAASAPRAPDPGVDPAGAWSGFLATRLGVPEATLHDPGLEVSLRARGLPPALAARAAELFERLQAARYGGAAVADAEAQVRAAIADCRRALGEP